MLSQFISAHMRLRSSTTPSNLNSFLYKAGLTLLVSTLSACTSIGPGKLNTDQFNYSDSIGQAWKSQMLSNIVKLRYGDTPVFLEVSSIVNQYQLETEVGLKVLNGSSTTQGLSATGIYTDKPTISYNPIMGEAFSRGLLTPIPPETVFSLIQADWPANMVLQMTLKSINGVRNNAGGLLGSRKADPDFTEIANALYRVQREGGIGMRLEERADKSVSLVTFFSDNAVAVERDIQRLTELLDIEIGAGELPLVFSAVRRNKQEIAVLTRSMLDILVALSAQVSVPQADVESRRATPNEVHSAMRLMTVKSGPEEPDDAFIAIPYRRNWFWIEDIDLDSKRMLTVMVLLFSLVQTGSVNPVAPVLTIPAG